jgi:hypothetical protein
MPRSGSNPAIVVSDLNHARLHTLARQLADAQGRKRVTINEVLDEMFRNWDATSRLVSDVKQS